ncbi:MAG: hypothetical protein KatS3mg115_1333 [Candidatus Poribacteria bacterium]|nr:MAG: hypothetical protein KatS3mg115_1333 [Candidatus Poribacteria bacterium]
MGSGCSTHRGYFQQRLSLDGWQIEGYPFNDPAILPMRQVVQEDGSPLLVEVLVGGERTRAAVWRVEVGIVPLFLLDTNIPENPPHLRSITDRLYGGDDHHRLSQEIVLGIGGVPRLARNGYGARSLSHERGATPPSFRSSAFGS